MLYLVRTILITQRTLTSMLAFHKARYDDGLAEHNPYLTNVKMFYHTLTYTKCCL